MAARDRRRGCVTLRTRAAPRHAARRRLPARAIMLLYAATQPRATQSATFFFLFERHCRRARAPRFLPRARAAARGSATDARSHKSQRAGARAIIDDAMRRRTMPPND